MVTHTDLIARLRGDYTLGKSTYALMEAADALTAAQERIEALEGALRRVSTFPIPRGFGVHKQPSADAMRDIARAALAKAGRA